MEKYCRNYTDTDISDIVKKIEIRNREFKDLKEKLETYFKFEITDYIIRTYWIVKIIIMFV